jgi:integrase
MIEDSRVGRAWRHVVGPGGDPFEADAITEGSWLVYHFGLSNLERYCAERNLVTLPAEPETLKGWIRWMSDEEGLSAKTVATYLTGVLIAHDERNMPINTRALKKTLKAVREKASPRQAAPLMAADLKDIMKTLDIKRPADCRDAVVCLTGLLCGLRQDEITTLDWERDGPPSNGRKGYMRAVRGGYELTLLTSKASKGKPHTFTITNRDAPSLRKWLDAWLAFARIEPGTPLIRSVSRWGHIGQMRPKSRAICDLIRRRVSRQLLAGGAKAADAFMRARRFGGHSLRAGLVSETARRRVDLWKMKARSRHKSTDILLGYVRIAEDRRDSAVKGLKL